MVKLTNYQITCIYRKGYSFLLVKRYNNDTMLIYSSMSSRHYTHNYNL
jgi:hypothetical protein